MPTQFPQESDDVENREGLNSVEPVINFDEEANKIVDKLTTVITTATAASDRWNSRHKGPYYKKGYAEAFKNIIDKMMINNRGRLFLYKSFPNLTRPRTLYLKLFQAKAYLLDKMDPDGKYGDYCEGLVMETKRGVGIILQHVDNNSEEAFSNPPELSDEPEGWKEKLDKYLEADKVHDAFEETGLTLTDQEVHDLEVLLAPLENVICHITQDRIKVVRTDMIRR